VNPVDLLRPTILLFSWFSLGVVASLVISNARRALKERGHLRRLNLAYAAARLGFIITIGLITELIQGAPEISADWRTWLYTIGIGLAAFGYLGVAVERLANGKEE
jgi:hypothetical protein